MRKIISSLFSVLGGLRRAVVLFLLLASLALNIATVTSTAVFAAVSGAVSAATGLTTVATREAGLHAKRRGAVRKTARQVTTRMQRSAARSSASVFAEAIPFVGIGVIAAVLALELRDACDTARDMHVLDGMMAEPDADPAVLEADFACADLIPQVDDVPDREAILKGMRETPGKAWAASRVWIDGLPEFTSSTLATGSDWLSDGFEWLSPWPDAPHTNEPIPSPP